MSVVDAVLSVRSLDDALNLFSQFSSDPLASFFEPKATFGAPAEPLFLAGVLMGLTILMLVLSFALDSCFRGGFVSRLVFGAIASAIVVSAFFVLIVLISGTVKVVFALSAPENATPGGAVNEFLISLAGACGAAFVCSCIIFVLLGKLLAISFN